MGSLATPGHCESRVEISQQAHLHLIATPLAQWELVFWKVFLTLTLVTGIWHVNWQTSFGSQRPV